MTDYKTVQINLVGSSNQSRTKAMSSERTLNLYPEQVPSGAYPSVLLPWPGSKVFSNTNTGTNIRGIYTHTRTGVVYKVVDTSLYSVSSDGVETLIGTIPGSDQVIFADDGVNMLIATSAYAYQYDGSTLSQITDSDYEAGGSVGVLNNQAIWQGLNERFAVADPGDPDSIQSLNYATAESSGDGLVRVYVFRETLYLLGEKTIESWYNSGVGSPPFDRIQSSRMEIGLIGKYAVDSNDNFLYWLGDDKNLYRASAYDPQSLMPPSIANQFESYDLSDAKVRCLRLDGQNFVLLLTSTKSWCYSETTGAWFELSYNNDEALYLADDYTYAYGKHLILNRLDGSVLELDLSTFTDNSKPTIRERITAPLNGAALGKNGGRMLMRRVELIMEAGIGNLSEENPLVMFSASFDGGQSFTNEDWVRAGRDGENRLRVEWYHMASFRQIQVKIRTSDPNFFTFHSMSIDVKMAGGF